MAECTKSLPVITGHGAPVDAPDTKTQFPLYYDLDARELYAWQGSWVQVRVPPHWMAARYEALPQHADWVTVGRGGEYMVAPLHALVAVIADALTLNDLQDVNVPAPQAGQALVNAGDQWVPGVPSRTLGSLEDVDVAKAGGDRELVFSGQQWAPGRIPLTLPELQDVTIDHPMQGQVLRHDGGWKNQALTMQLDELEDVVLTAPQAGQALMYDGVQWVNAALAPQFEIVECRYCAGEDGGRFLLISDDGERGQLMDGAAAATDGKDYLICPSAGSLWAKCAEDSPEAYRRIRADMSALLHMVMVLVSATTPEDLLTQYPDFPVGGYWLKLVDNGQAGVVMHYKAPGCHVEAPFTPRLVLNPGCGIWGRTSLADRKLRRLKVHASQLCVDACAEGPVNASTDMQTAICQVANSTGLSGQAGPCLNGLVLTTAKSYQDAVCALDTEIANLEQDIYGLDPAITPCASGPVNTATTVAGALCTLSAYLAGRVILPLAASKVNVTACSKGVVNADTDAQTALCQLSEVVANPTITTANISVNACPTDFSGGTAQDALCQLATLQQGDYPAVYAVAEGTADTTVLTDVADVSLYSGVQISQFTSRAAFSQITYKNGADTYVQYVTANNGNYFEAIPLSNEYKWLAFVSVAFEAIQGTAFQVALVHGHTTPWVGTYEYRHVILRGVAPDGSAKTHYTALAAVPLINRWFWLVELAHDGVPNTTINYRVDLTMIKVG